MTFQRFLWAVVFAAILYQPGSTAPGAEPGDRADHSAQQLIRGNNEFALEFYKQLARQDGNIAISPLSVSIATAMVYAGAAAKTATEIATTAHFELPWEVLHNGFAALVDDLEARAGKGKATLLFANGVWLDSQCVPSSQCRMILSKFYRASVEKVDFEGDPAGASKRINSFISQQTHGKIPSVVAPEMFTEYTSAVLANSVYFLARWQDTFSPRRTGKEPFHLSGGGTVSAQMMHRSGFVRYFGDDSLQIVELPYQRMGLSMLVLLPSPDHNLPDLEAQLTPAVLSGWLEALANTEVNIALPRFQVSRHINLVPVLQSMGIQRAFDALNAELPGWCAGSVFVNRAEHDVWLEVTEGGTEAAASTTVHLTKSIAIAPEISFRADRPFMYLIRDTDRGTILFMGRVVDPTK